MMQPLSVTSDCFILHVLINNTIRRVYYIAAPKASALYFKAYAVRFLVNLNVFSWQVFVSCTRTAHSYLLLSMFSGVKKLK